MKVLKRILIVIFCLIVLVVIGGYFFLKNFDVNNYKTQIEQKLSENLQRKVKIDTIRLNLNNLNGVALQVNNFAISQEDPLSEPNYFFKASNALLQIDLKRLIFKKEVFVQKIKVFGADIYLLKNEEGQISLPMTGNNGSGGAISKEVHSDSSNTKATNDIQISSVTIQSILIENATVHYHDESLTPPLKINLDRINVLINNFTFRKKFPILVEASLFSKAQNIKVSGDGFIDDKNKNVVIENVKFNTNLSSFSYKELIQGFEPLQAFKVEGGLSGNLNAQLDKLMISDGKLSSLNLIGSLNDGKVKLEAFPYPLNNIDLRFVMNEQKLDIKDFSFALVSGIVSSKGTITDYLTIPSIDFSLEVQDLIFEELLDEKTLPVELVGRLSGRYNISGSKVNWQHILNYISGSGSFEVEGGELKDVNILKIVFDNILGLSLFSELGLADAFMVNLPDKVQKLVKERDMTINKMQILSELQDGKIIINPIQIEAEGVAFTIQGFIDQNQRASLKAHATLQDELTKDILDSREEFNVLLNSEGNIEIPFSSYEGPLSDASLRPDTSYLRNKLLGSAAKTQLNKILNRALGVEDQPTTKSSGQNDINDPNIQQDNPPEKRSAEEQLIEGILKSIPLFE